MVLMLLIVVMVLMVSCVDQGDGVGCVDGGDCASLKPKRTCTIAHSIAIEYPCTC